MKKYNFPFVATPSATIVYLILLVATMFVFLGRSSISLRPSFWDKEFYSHVSNYCISYFLVSIIGYIWLQQGLKLNRVVVFGLVIIAINYVYELWLPIINTPDIIDAHFGAVGTIVVIIFSLFISWKGLIPNPKYQNSKKACSSKEETESVEVAQPYAVCWQKR